MNRYAPRRATAAPRWFVAALLAGAAAITAASAVLPPTAPPADWRIAQ